MSTRPFVHAVRALRVFPIAAALGLGLLHGVAHALSDADFLSANRTFQSAAAGDGDALAQATRTFASLQQAEPGNPVPLAYAGALETLRARETMLPWRKLGHAEDGLARIDKSLAMLTPAHDSERIAGTPVTLLVKFTAASTCLAMPASLNRGARGRQLLDDVLTHPAYAGTPQPFRDAVQRVANAQGQAARSAP